MPNVTKASSALTTSRHPGGINTRTATSAASTPAAHAWSIIPVRGNQGMPAAMLSTAILQIQDGAACT
jgi:hypothetical protein